MGNSQKNYPANGHIIQENSLRRDEFKTCTVIAEETGKKTVYKYASNPEALPFLKLITDRERENVDYLKDCFEVLCGNLETDRIKYQFLPYQSLQDVIKQHLSQGSYDSANELFHRYRTKIQSLPMVNTVPEEFLRTLAGEKHIDNLKMPCLFRGLLDLTPRNILIDGNRWITIDNEWSFDFPIPCIFVLFRAVRELAAELQYEIRLSACPENPVIGLFARGLQTRYVPLAWVSDIIIPYIALHRLLLWEINFQFYLTGNYYGVTDSTRG